MKSYLLLADDQKYDNWIIKRWTERYREPALLPLPQYGGYVCGQCGQIDFDKVFEIGFENAKKVRGKGDMLRSDDNFWCMRQNLVDLFLQEAINGVRFKRVADSEWYVVNIVKRLQAASETFQAIGSNCPECGRNTEVLGTVLHLGHLLEQPPEHSLFSTMQYNERFDRDVLIDESVLKLLLNAQITGGTARELLPTGEYQRLSKAWKQGEKVEIPQVFL